MVCDGDSFLCNVNVHFPEREKDSARFHDRLNAIFSELSQLINKFKTVRGARSIDINRKVAAAAIQLIPDSSNPR